MTPATYRPIPVAEARRIAQRFGKDLVVIFAYEEGNNISHTTTFGASLPYKHIAADLGEQFASIAGASNERIRFQDFRVRVEGTYEEER